MIQRFDLEGERHWEKNLWGRVDFQMGVRGRVVE